MISRDFIDHDKIYDNVSRDEPFERAFKHISIAHASEYARLQET